MKKRFFIGIILAAVCYISWSGKSEEQMKAASEDSLAGAIQLVSSIQPYEENREYIDDVVRQAHEQAFDLTYSKGVPRLRINSTDTSKFREDDYSKWLLHYAIRQVAHDFNERGGEIEVVRLRSIKSALEALRDELGIKKFGM